MRKFKTCGCSRFDTKCVKTGFDFNYGGVETHGDLFLCRAHNSLHIDGFILPPFTENLKIKEGQVIGEFEGGVRRRDDDTEYLMTLYGTVTLTDEDCEYVEGGKWPIALPSEVEQ